MAKDRKPELPTKRLQTPIPREQWQAVSDLMWAAVGLSRFTGKSIIESLRYLLTQTTLDANASRGKD